MAEGAVKPRLPDEWDHPDKLDAGLLRITGVCVLARIMVILDITIVSVAQRTFITQFGSTQAVVAWTITGYTLALATVIPMAGWAADRVGTKRLFLGSVLAFACGSLLCAMAPNITALIAFRVLEGLGGGMLLPLKYTILTREAGPRRLGRLMAALAIPTLLGPVCGPVLGGWLIGMLDWQWIFLINVPTGLIVFVIAGIVLPKDQPTTVGSFDLVGMLLLSPGLAAFLYGLSSVPGRGTVADFHVWMPATVGLGLITGFVFHALYRADHPLIDLRLFKIPVVALAAAGMFFYDAAVHGAVLLLPSYLQQVLHQTPLQSGVHLIPKGLGAMLTVLIAGAITDKRGPRRIVSAGVVLIAMGMSIFTYGVSQQAPYRPILLAGLAIIGMGMGCIMVPLSTAAMRVLRPDQVARGSTLISVNMQAAASVGTALMAVILTSQFNRSENVSAANKLAILRADDARRGVPLDSSALPRHVLAPDFTGNVLHDLSHAYAAVFAVAVVLVALAFIPVAFLPENPVAPVLQQPPLPARVSAPEQPLRDPFGRAHRIGRLHPRVDRVIEPQHRKPVRQ
ncbi:DHA2 family efflux MFS transporter permease subunit [Mycobacterium sp.]|uniref:DHA2 family efflux MFS transporter permease subunit n=1 Tax=Mycobacterium sp. TaxID=1785 RepID=UPI003D6A8167